MSCCCMKRLTDYTGTNDAAIAQTHSTQDTAQPVTYRTRTSTGCRQRHDDENYYSNCTGYRSRYDDIYDDTTTRRTEAPTSSILLCPGRFVYPKANIETTRTAVLYDEDNIMPYEDTPASARVNVLWLRTGNISSSPTVTQNHHCHNSRYRPLDGPQTRRSDPPAISCCTSTRSGSE